MPICVCVSRVIFKTGKSCQFGYALVASFSKQENHANLGYVLVTSFSKQEKHVNLGMR